MKKVTQSAAVKTHMMCAALTSTNTVNQLRTLSAVNKDTVTATENAGPTPSHAVMPQPSTVSTNTTLALNTAAVTALSHAVKRERNVFHTLLCAVTTERRSAMAAVFHNTITAANTELNIANTQINVKNTAVNLELNTAHGPKSVKYTVAQPTKNGVNTLTNAQIYHAATQTPHTANTLELARNTAANTTTKFTISTAQSMMNAETNATAVNTDTKPANAKVEPMTLIPPAMLLEAKNAVMNTGVNLLTNALLTKKLAV